MDWTFCDFRSSNYRGEPPSLRLLIARRFLGDGFGRPFEGMQTWNVPVGGGAIFELRLAETGLYPFVTHAFADARSSELSGPSWSGLHSF